MNKNAVIIIVIIVVALVAIGGYFILKPQPAGAPVTQAVATTTDTGAMATTTDTTAASNTEVIGTSVNGNPITAYHYGTGGDEILFVGGIHGGYEANTVLTAADLMDYLDSNPSAIPANEKITVIPVLNPDGLQKVLNTTTASFSSSDIPALATTIPGRFNANNVDLNRNFDCHWQATGVWQNTKVSGGTAAFSEPESQAIQTYVAAHPLVGAVVWYSSAGGVYSAGCDSVSAATAALTKAFAAASGYPAHASFDAYATTGDMTNWLTTKGIPTISVLLTNHTDAEWGKNQPGVLAVLKYFAK